MQSNILQGDVLAGLGSLADGSVQTCVTSPPYYGLRDYGTAKWEGGRSGCDHTGVARRCDKPGRNDKQSTQKGSSSDRVSWSCLKCGARRVDDQIGLEPTPDEYVARLVGVFREVRRVLADDGTVFLNLGDSYGKGKQLLGIPWRVAFALQADGWYLRQDIIWHKPNPMPESVRDRCTKAHEYVFLLSKSPRYFYDADAVREPSARQDLIGATSRNFGPQSKLAAFASSQRRQSRNVEYCDVRGRNRRSVWTVAPKPFRLAHFAVMPEALVEPCLLAGSRPGDLVLDTFCGSGTVGVVARRHGRAFVGCELNPEYAAMARTRIAA